MTFYNASSNNVSDTINQYSNLYFSPRTNMRPNARVLGLDALHYCTEKEVISD
jgi:hypothetical protein